MASLYPDAVVEGLRPGTPQPDPRLAVSSPWPARPPVFDSGSIHPGLGPGTWDRGRVQSPRHLPGPYLDEEGYPIVPEVLDVILREYDDNQVFMNFSAGRAIRCEFGSGDDGAIPSRNRRDETVLEARKSPCSQMGETRNRRPSPNGRLARTRARRVGFCLSIHEKYPSYPGSEPMNRIAWRSDLTPDPVALALISMAALAFDDPPAAAKAEAVGTRPQIGRSFQVPYRLTDTNHFLVRVRINGKGPFNFLVDSGAAGALRRHRDGQEDRPEAGHATHSGRPSIASTIEGGARLTSIKARVEDPFQLVGMNALGLPGASIDGILGFTILAPVPPGDRPHPGPDDLDPAGLRAARPAGAPTQAGRGCHGAAGNAGDERAWDRSPRGWPS